LDGEEDVERSRLRTDTLLLERQQRALDAGAEADARRGRPPELGDKRVVAAAGTDRRLRLLLGADELEDGTRVVVEPADERRLDGVVDPVGVEVTADRREVGFALGTERLADLRRG